MQKSANTPITKGIRTAYLPGRSPQNEVCGQGMSALFVFLLMLIGINSWAFSHSFSENYSSEFHCSLAFENKVQSAMAVVLTETHDDITCFGDNDGAIDLTITGAVPPLIIDWDIDGLGDNDDTEDLSGLAPATYTVHVTDATAITQSLSVTINEPAALSSVESAQDATINGVANGKGWVTVSGGSAPYTYLWSDTQNTDTLFAVAGGKYYVDITDFNGCTVLDSVSIDEPAALSLTLNQTNVNCFAGNDAQADVAASGGVAPYSYLWTGGSTNDTLFDATAQKYYITVTDFNGASKLDSVTITEPAALTSIETAQDATINGAANGKGWVTVSGGTAPYTYLWSDAQNTDTLFAVTAGKYYVDISDFNGCTALDSVIIDEPTALALTLNQINVNCFGENNGQADVAVTGGVAPYTYLWTGGSTNDTLFDASAQKYYITVTDFNGATKLDSVTITEPTEMTSIETAQAATVHGVADGKGWVTVSGGTAPYTYLWSDAQNTDTLFAVAAGKYYVNITDFNGCAVVDSVTINEPAALDLTINKTDVDCNGNSTGKADVVVTGGVAPYSYAWSDTTTNDTLFTASAQKYYITVTDFNGATKLDSVTITEPIALTSIETAHDATINGVANGKGWVTVSGGTAPYTYLWSDAQNTDTLFAIAAGKYYVDITDFNGCTALDSVVIDEPIALDLTLNQSNATCYGGINGQADVTASGGVAPYSYLWTGGSTNDTLFDAAAQKYYITVTDFNGATKLDSVIITEPTEMTSIETAQAATINGVADGKGWVTVSGGTAPYTYLWSDAQNTDTLFAVAAGKYYVNITDFNGCTVLDSVIIAEPAELSLTLNQTNVNCFAGNDGQADVSVSGGVAPYTYAWSDATIDDTLFAASAQKYYITVTDFNGATKLDSVSITEPTALISSETTQDATINGAANGKGWVTVSGGTAPYSYAWTGGQNTDTLFTVIAGKYYVDITDFNGCTALDSVIIDEPTALVLTLNQTNVTCFSGNDGQADVSVSGGVAPYNYAWSDATSDDTLFTATAQKYYITVTDFNGATKLDSVIVTEPTAITSTETAQDATINGGSDGKGWVTVTGGTAPYAYLWSDTQNTDTLFAVAPGIYYVDITDFNGCTALDSVIISEPAALALTLNQSNVSCFGGNDGQADVEVAGGVAPYSYAWSDATTDDTLITASAQKYYITVTDINGATKLDSVTITEPSALTSIETAQDATINGVANGKGWVTVSGGTAPYTYLWSDAQNTDTLYAVVAGKYYVDITDFNGCTALDSVTISEPAALALTLNQSDASCFGGVDGQADVVATGGVAPYTYVWSDATSNDTLFAAAAQKYYITVTDVNGATKLDSVAISQPTAITSLETAQDATTNGGADGKGWVTVSGGTAPYTYLWSNAQNTDTLFAVADGKYYVDITDFNGCTALDSVIISEPAALALTLNQSNVTCFGENNGQADVAVSGGVGPYTYLWTGGSTNDTLFDAIAQKYYITVTDFYGSAKLDSVIITEPTAITSIETAQDATINGGTDGKGWVTVSGGTAPYSYSWTGGQNTDTLFAVAAGKYYVDITDFDGCTALDSVIISEPAALTLTLNQSNVSCFGGSDGQADVSVVGGVAPYIFLWSNASTNDTLFDAIAQKYYVTVTDFNGASQMDSVTITEPTVLSSIETAQDATINGAANGKGWVTVSGGTAPYTYAWTGGQNTDTLFAAAAGKYYVDITDDKGCTLLDSVIIGEPTALALTINKTDVDCNGAATGQADIEVTGGVAPYTFLWSTASTNDTIFSLIAGNYSVTVTDALGAVDIASVTIDEPTVLSIAAAATSFRGTWNIACHGTAVGSAGVTFVGGGTAPYSYAWSNGTAGDTLVDVVAGTYTLTVTDFNGCTATDDVTLTEPDTLEAVFTIDNTISCFGAADGEASVIITGGAAPYNYAWNGLGGINSKTGLAEGWAVLEVTDNNGCVLLDSIYLAAPESLSFAVDVTNIGCSGATAGAIDLTVTGGTGGYDFDWDNDGLGEGGDSEDLSSLAAGDYHIYVTDTRGCAKDTIITVTEATAITITETHDDISCYGTATGAIDLTINGGNAPYTFDWDTDATGDFDDAEDLPSLIVGDYKVVVRDGNGCKDSLTITLTQPDTLDVSGALTHLTCDESANGAINVTVTDGTAPYTFDWDLDGTGDFDDTEDIAGLSEGTYTLVVRDALLCEFTSSYTLTQPDTLSITPAITHVVCSGNSNGAISIVMAGGTAPYIFDWAHIPGANNPKDIINRMAGDYNLTVTDAQGCVFSETFTINQPAILSVTETHADANCFGGNDGSIDITVAGGTAPYTFDWDTDVAGDFDDAKDLTGLEADDYTVIVKDANDCITSITASIAEPASLVLSATPVSPLCSGATDGSIDLTVSGGTSPYSFDWDINGWGIGPDSEDLSGLASGSYAVIVTDGHDCKDTLTVEVLDPLTLSLSVVESDASCFGGNDGAIDLTIIGGEAPFTIDWDNDGTGDNDDFQDISGLSEGTYAVIVTDNNNCSATIDVTIDEPTELVIDRAIMHISCFGGSDGEIDLSISGGTAPYQYDWNMDGTGDFDDIEDPESLTAGTYSVTVRDALSCVKTRSITITEPAVLSLTETHIDPACFGDNDGSINVSIAGGTAPYAFDWDTDGIGDYDDTEDLTGLINGTYTLFVRDAEGCQLDTTISISEPSELLLSESHINVTCAGDNDASIDITVAGGTPNAFAPFYQYDWAHLPGVNNPEDLTGISDGTYKVYVRDANSCLDSISITVGTTSTIILNSTAADADCYGGSTGGIDLTVSGTAVAPLTYDWDHNGVGVFSAGTSDSQDLLNMSAGDYEVIVTDATGCSASLTATIGEPAVLQAHTTFTTTSCATLNDATASAAPTGGTGTYSYAWSSGANTATASGLTSGKYYVTVTDDNACTVLDSVIIPHIDLLSVSATVSSDYFGEDISCANASDGSAQAIPSGGVGPFTYAWNDPLNQSNAALINVEDGTYEVTVTDSRLCTATATVTLNDPVAMLPSISVSSSNAGGGVSCGGSADADIELTVVNGAAPLTYDWDIDGTGDFDDADNLSNLSAGTYNVIIRDANGCTVNDAITITEPNSMSGTLSASNYGGFNVSCNGGSDGQLVANIAGGSPPYSFAWNGASATNNNTISSLSAGFNQVIVTDDNGCSITLNQSLTEPAAINLTITTAPPTDCDVDNGIINIVASGGLSPYEYSKDNGATWQTLNYFTGLATGSYSVVVRSTVGSCQTPIQNTVIDAAEAPQIDNLTIINPSGAATTDGAVLVDASGNGLSLQYSVDGGPFQSSNLFSGLSAGGHTVCVRYVGQTCTSCQPFTMTAGGGVVGATSDTEICSHTESLTGFVETYYIPMPEDLMLDAYQSIYDVGTCGLIGEAPVGPMHSYNSIGVVETGTIIHYDHWEVDGFEANLSFPVQPSTEIWGDNDASNGIPPGFATDLLNAGDIIILQATVDVTDLDAIDYDGGDKFGSKGDLSYSKMTWASGSSTFLAGAAEVLPREKWATSFIVPVGEDTDVNSMFSYTGATIIAMTDGTSVTINNAGAIVNVTLDEGESHLVDGGLDAGTTIEATEPIQVQLITGDRCETFESRFYTLTSRDLWSDNYYNPVTSEPSRDTYVHLYNPNSVNITVYMERTGGIVSSHFVGANSTSFIDLPENSGTRFYTTDGREFYSIATIHSNSSANGADWGYALLPNSLLSGQITLVGFAPGENPLDPDGGNYQPIWITGDHPQGSAFAGNPITIYVDFNGDGGVNTDANGSQYDQDYTINELGKLKIFDPDGDQTGMKIWVGDASDAFIAGAYGQDPSLEVGGNTAQLDLGTGVFNRIPFSAALCVDLYTDFLNNNVYDECDEVIYTASIHNTGSLPLAASSLNLIDTLSSAVTYVPGTTVIYAPSGITAVPDDSNPLTPFPLDEDGSQVSSVIQPGDSILVKWVATINDASSASFIRNIAYVENANTALAPEVSFPVQNPTSVSIPAIPTDVTIACDDAIALPPFQDTCLTSIFISNVPWTKHFVDSEDSSPATPAELAFDDDPDTYWMTLNPGSAHPYPHEFQVDMGEEHLNVMSVRYTPRQDAVAGRIEDFELFTSTDGSTWTLQATGSFDGTADFHDINFDAVDARYIRLRAISSSDGNAWAAIAELSVSKCGNSVVYNESSNQVTDGSCDEYNYQITRDWTVTNHCGNVGVQSQIITVEDTESPVINGVPANDTYTEGNVPAPPVLTATDNCATVTVSYTADTVMVGCNRQITRTWSSIDPCGNPASESQIITELTCPEICDDGIDNDGDGLIDCADDECFNNLVLDLGDDAKICDGEAIDLEAVVSGGHAPYTVSWDNGLPDGTSNTVSPATNTTYTATVSDTYSCQTSDDILIRVNDNEITGMIFNNLAGADVTIVDGATYNLSSLPGNFNLQAQHSSNNGSMELTLTGPVTGVEEDDTAPYILGADPSPMALVVGDYCFTAIVFARDNDNTDMCDSLTVCFTILDNEICDDGIDNDGDGLVDCEDPDCAAFDFDGDTVCDEDDLDDDNDGILDTVEGDVDTDGDGANNPVDYDSDGDGCPDVIEAGFTDQNGDDLLANLPTIVDADGLVLGTDSIDGYGTPADDNGNFIYDFLEDTDLLITCPSDTIVYLDATCLYPLGDFRSLANVIGECSSYALEQTPAIGTLYGVSDRNITLKVTDDLGNTASCTFQVSIRDNTPPVAVCRDTTVYLNAAASAVVSAAMIDNGSNDNCEIDTRSLDITSFDCGDLGAASTVVLTVSDASGNTATCAANVTVLDTIAPAINCPANIVTSSDEGVCGAVVNYTAPIGTDNCTGVVTAQSDVTGLSSGSVFPVGTTIIEYTVTDASNNTATCSFTVTVNDTEAPEISCPGAITVAAAVGTCGQAVVFADPTISDNCPGTVFVQTDLTGLSSGSTFPVGVTTLSYRATDVAGNTDECSFTVTIVDNEMPTISCPGDIAVGNSPGLCGAVVNYAAPIGADNCPGQSTAQSDATGLSSGDEFPLGTTTLIYTVTDNAGNTASCSFDIVVSDTEAPFAACQTDTLDLGTGSVSLFPVDVFDAISSSDNCPIVVPDSVFPNTFTAVGTYPVTLWVSDAAGNVSSCMSNVVVIDLAPPVCNVQDITVQLDVDGLISIDPMDIDDGSTDNGVITTYALNQSDFDCSHIGVNPVELTITDDAGNTAVCTANVTVEDIMAPAIACKDHTVFLDATGNASITTAMIDDGTTDNCGFTLALDVTDFYCDDTGVNPVVLTATDASGNSSICNAQVTVTDNILPSINCPANITVDSDPTLCGAVVSYVAPIGTDNCSFATTNKVDATGLVSGDVFPVGVSTLTYQVTDASGNTATCSFTITVTDIQNPEITCPGDISVNVDAGQCGAIVNYAEPVGTDNCSAGLNTVQTDVTGLSTGSQFPVGTTTLEYTVTDAAGNSAVCSFDITVTDNEAPSITCNTDIAVDTDLGACGAVVNYAAPAGSDNCPGAITTQIDATGLSSGSLFPVGRTTLEYQVTDAYGNSAICSFNVDVSDAENPVAACQTVTIDLVGATVTLDPADVYDAANSSDNCSVSPLSVTPNTFSADGTYTVTLTVTDPAGNTDDCTVDITVEDTNPPTCVPNDITVFLDVNGDATILASQIDGGSFDNDGIASIVASDTNFDCSELGANDVTLTVTDAGGNTSQCIAVVTVVDNIPPAIVCQDITVALDASGNVSITAGQLDGGTTDACGYSLTADILAFDCDDTGVNNVELTATDASGNSSTCIAEVTVEDLILPDMDCTDPIIVNTDPGVCGAAVTYTLPAVTDNCSSSIVAQLTTGAGHASGSTFPVGTTFVGYSATNPYNGQAVTCSFPITVTDNEPPTISCPADIVVNSDLGICGALVNYTAPIGSDNCLATTDQTDATGLSSGSTFPIGTTTLEYTVTDATGNTAVCSFTITVNDAELPVVTTCPGDISINTDLGVCGATVSYAAPTATDNCTVSSITQTDGTGYTSGDIFPVGTTDLVYTITDASGNTSLCEFSVTIVDNEDPVAVCQTVTLNLGGGTVLLASVQVFDPASSDNCPTVTPISVTPDTFTAVGTYSVTLTVEDESGNTDQCTVDIMVEDTTPPDAICIAGGIDVYLDATGNVSILGEDLDGGSTDNGQIVSYVASQDAFTCAHLGANSVTLTVTDDGGNTADCVTNVQVIDTIPPTPICQNVTMHLDATGNASITTDTINNGSSDICGISTFALDQTAFDCSHVTTTNTVTLTVTDTSGNTATCSAEVMILDTIAPSITCPAAITQDTDPSLSTATVIVPVPVTDDNCAVATLTNDFNGTGNASGVYPNGPTTVTWTVTDVNGNSKQCSMTVTIEDNTPPEITCPPHIDVDATIGLCETDVVVIVPTVSDNDGIAGLVNDYNFTDNATDTYSVGDTVVTWVVTDVNGNTASCWHTVTVRDVEAPTVSSCPADTMINATIGECGIDAVLVTLETPVATDPCGIVNITNDAPGYYPVGETTVTWAMADTSGNVSNCTQLVTILDVENPTLTFCPADVTVDTDLGVCGTALGNVPLGLATGTDPCGDPVVTHNGPALFPVGQTTVTWYLEDINGNIDSTCTQVVTVNDTENPIITDCPGAIDFDATVDECGIDATLVDIGTLTATDNCGFVVVSNDAPAYFPVGQTTVTWTVLDGISNSSTCEQIVTINDVQPVVDLVCPADTIITATIGECGINTALVTLDPPTATDACGVVNITNDAPAFYPVGETLVTWTIADTSGNALNCEQMVTITDDEAPTLTSCPTDETVNVDDGECGTALVNVPIGMPTAIDPCGIASIVHNAPDTFLVGETTVIWTITDSNANTSICTQTITVIDDEAPIILVCPAAVDVDATIDECGSDSLLVDLGILDATDPCGIDTIFNNGLAYYPVGQTTVTWTVIDNNELISNCDQIVTIHDVQPPVNLVCPLDTVITATIGECGIDAALVTLISPTADDACGIVNISNDAPIFYPVGETLVTWTIADTSGNFLNCEQLVTITDDELPTVTVCSSDIIVSNDLGVCGAIVTYPMPEATDPCGIASITMTEGLASGEEFPIGVTTVTYEIIDVNDNLSICTFDVTVNDTEAPVFADPVIINYDAIEGECESLVTFNIPVGSDNCPDAVTVQTDGTGMTTGDIFPVGITELCYLVTDASGNSTELCIDINVLDVEAPIIVACPEDLEMTADDGVCGTFFMPSPPQATDNCGDVIFSHDGPMTFPVGTTNVTWTISDDAGNSVYCYQNITVTDDELPEITCPSDELVIADWGACDALVAIGLTMTQDNCAVDSVWNDFNGTSDASDIYPLGETLVTWTVLDVNGNLDSCTTLVTVETPGAPIIACPDDIEVLAAEGECGQNIIVPTVEIDNPCSIVSVVNDYTGTDDASDTYPVGVTVVTWTITDITGYESECSMNIIVVDDQLPTISCPEDISLSNDPGICGAYVTYAIPVVADNCAIQDLVLVDGLAPGDLFSVGSTQVSYLVTDVWGNSAACSFEVTITDDEAPVIACPENIVQIDSIVNYPYPDYSDNCYAELILVEGPDSGDDFDHGYTDVYFAAVDLNGNMDTCSFQVLVNTPPVAVNDTVVIFESDDTIEIEIIANDYDLDGDSIFIYELLSGNSLASLEGDLMYYNIPDNECGIDSVTYVLMDEYGATDTATVFVDVECHPTVFVPEGFSPNGDGVNDVLHILGIHEYPDNKLMVFNRWGHKVYERESYQNDWSGKSEAELTIGLTNLPRATYYYLLDLGDSKIKPMKGFFYINPE